MSDETFLIVVAIGFGIFIIGTYVIFRTLGKKYEPQVEKIRKLIAVYSVPVILLLIFTVSYFNSREEIRCSEGSEGIAFWTCGVSFLLVPLLFISMSLGWVYSQRLRGRRGLFERLSTKDKSKLPRVRDTYSKLYIVATVATLLIGLLGYFYL